MVKYPSGCTSPSDKTEFLYRAQELLRLEHNEMGEQFRNKTIDRLAWMNYLDNDFNPKSEAIVKDILENRALLKQSTKYSVVLDDIVMQEE